MRSYQSNLTNSIVSETVLTSSPIRNKFLWKNLVIEKRVSMNWIDRLYEASIVHAFWSVLSSPEI
jgi:hypothetical protein